MLELMWKLQMKDTKSIEFALIPYINIYEFVHLFQQIDEDIKRKIFSLIILKWKQYNKLASEFIKNEIHRLKWRWHISISSLEILTLKGLSLNSIQIKSLDIKCNQKINRNDNEIEDEII